MTDTLLLTINNHPLSLSESLTYLRVAGKLQPFLMEIVQQYILKQEISAVADIDTVEQYYDRFSAATATCQTREIRAMADH
jgi:hypothetical protein